MADATNNYNFASYAQAITIAASLSFVLSVFHESGFYLALGFGINKFPIGLVDVLNQTIVWLPHSALAMLIGFTLVLKWRQTETDLGSSPWIYYIVAFLILCYGLFILYGEERIRFLGYAIAAQISFVMIQILRRFGLIDVAYLISLAILATTWMFFHGYDRGIDALSGGDMNDKIILDNGGAVEHVNILRNLDAGVLFISADKQVTFLPVGSYQRAEFEPRQEVWRGVCSYVDFRVC